MREDRLEASRLDDVIDRAVREITDVEPQAGFDHRVMRRLARRRPPVAVPRFAIATAAAAALLLLAVVLRDGPERPVAPPSTPAAAVDTPLAERPVRREPTVSTEAPTRRTARTRTSAPPRRGMVTAASIADMPEGPSEDAPVIVMLPGLDAPPALAVDGIRQRAVNLPEITMSSIEIDRLNLEPLRPGNERREE